MVPNALGPLAERDVAFPPGNGPDSWQPATMTSAKLTFEVAHIPMICFAKLDLNEPTLPGTPLSTSPRLGLNR